MFKAVMGKLTCGVALLFGFVACGVGSEESSDGPAAHGATEAVEESVGELPVAPSEGTGSGEAAAAGSADTSAAVEASGLVCTDCYLNLVTCFPDRDAIFEASGVLCVCQNPDLDNCCGTSLVDLECNL